MAGGSTTARERLEGSDPSAHEALIARRLGFGGLGLCASNGLLIYRNGTFAAPAEFPMTATQAWFLTVSLVVGIVVVFFFLGFNLAAEIGTALHGIEHFLGEPLALPSLAAASRLPAH
ncbi:MAG: hypothetical protein L3K00_01740 [Thermoplasmata archaeon]|nr:hypothetical protein [Thermoplasmata archaeon]